MTYLLVKSIHIFAAILWIGALCVVSFVTSSHKMNQQQIGIATRVTEAAIGLTWLAGIILVILGSWYSSTWWHIKVLLVILISAIHTIVHRRWRSATSDGAATNRVVPIVILILTFLVVLLAVFKNTI